MNFIKRLLKTNKSQGKPWTMFSSAKSEVEKMLISTGQLTIGDNFLKLENYPFEPSIAYRQSIIQAEHIQDIDLHSYPPNIRVGNEILFLTREKKDELEEFAKRNKLNTIERPTIWGWILEPFLDTEYTPETDQRLMELLGKYGFSIEQIKYLRAEVETQMLKYNFDTMLWEWGGFDTLDVLKAMRTKYNPHEFRDFYKRAMEIALASTSS
ncbi:MAG: hypothetical protein CFE21_11325 [Bacteroidetes bacterium B1(2017)]|nr:MAG: hypothetical protein CFE21_11325 [Bacteroidetes bacterium B1(2017)]